MIYIGIDTGVHTGIAIWDNRKRSLEMVKQMPIHRAMAVVQSYADMQKTGVGDKIIVRVEDPRQRTWFGTERMTREEERKRLQGVGSVKRDATIWEDYLTELGVEFEMVAPKTEYNKDEPGIFQAAYGMEKANQRA